VAVARTTRPPLWRDVRVVRVVLQVAFVVAVVALLYYLYDNLRVNLVNRGLRTDFDFLDQPAGFQIAGSDFRSTQTVSDALWVGVRNTLSLAVLGVVLTTILGVIVGVARLSGNWLVRKAAAFYVETLRNIPPVLVVIFTFTVVILGLPRIQEAREVGGVLVLSNREVAVAGLHFDDGTGAFALALLGALAVAVAVGAWRTRRWNATGRPHHRVLWGAAVVLVIGTVAWLALGGPVTGTLPDVEGLGVTGGVAMKGAYVAMLVALVAYTASHVAEIVRGSIQAVPRGQVEAATALGLSELQRLRHVVLPQAFRIAIPPLINQYLNLLKNTSLAVAIGFPEITQLGRIVVGNGNPAPQVIAITMGVYLCFSLVISAATNLVNRRLQVVGR
jgi:general L-amino acid transport system permease protein